MVLADFVSECRDHAAGPDPLPRIRSAMEKLLANAETLQAELPQPSDTPISGQSDELFVDDTISIMVVHTPPAVEQPPHDHLMSVVIGGFRGVETQRLFRRTPDGDAPIEPSGKTEVGVGDVFTLGPQGIHAINAVGPEWAGAVHVYLGRLSAAKRSLFHPDTFAEEPLDLTTYDSYCRARTPAQAPASGL